MMMHGTRVRNPMNQSDEYRAALTCIMRTAERVKCSSPP